jgi:hypothetical protein
MDLLSLLLIVIVFGLIYYCVTLLPIPAPFKTIAVVIVLIVAIVYLFGLIGGGAPHVRIG